MTVIYTSLQGQLVCPQYAVPIHHIPFHYAMTDVYLAVIYGFVTKSHIYKYMVHVHVKNKCCTQIYIEKLVSTHNQSGLCVLC